MSHLDKLKLLISSINEINSSTTYTETYVIVESNTLSGWFDGIVFEILQKLDPNNYLSHTKYHSALHYYYDKNKVWVDSYYLRHPYLFQIVKTLGHWALNNRQVELRVVEIPICQSIVGISNGVFQYSKSTDPSEVIMRIEEQEKFKKSLLPAEEVHRIIMEEVEREVRSTSSTFTECAHLKWSEERIINMRADII